MSSANIFNDSISFEEIQQRIRKLAYQKWQNSGCVVGHDGKFWEEAENEIVGNENVKNGGYYIYIKKNNNLCRVFLSPIYNTCRHPNNVMY